MQVVIVAGAGAASGVPSRVSRRWPKLRPVERQRWREEVELQIETYPAAAVATAARGSTKHAREKVFSVQSEMGLRDPRRGVPRRGPVPCYRCGRL